MPSHPHVISAPVTDPRRTGERAPLSDAVDRRNKGF